MSFLQVDSSEFGAVRRLWLSVLRRAVFDYLDSFDKMEKGSLSSASASAVQELYEDTRQFLFEESLEREPDDDVPHLTFSEICAIVGWEVDSVRSEIRRLNIRTIRKFESGLLAEYVNSGEHAAIEHRSVWEVTGASGPALCPFLLSKEAAADLIPRRVSFRPLQPELLGSWAHDVPVVDFRALYEDCSARLRQTV